MPKAGAGEINGKHPQRPKISGSDGVKALCRDISLPWCWTLWTLCTMSGQALESASSEVWANVGYKLPLAVPWGMQDHNLLFLAAGDSPEGSAPRHHQELEQPTGSCLQLFTTGMELPALLLTLLTGTGLAPTLYDRLCTIACAGPAARLVRSLLPWPPVMRASTAPAALSSSGHHRPHSAATQ